jgi:tRNA pseudouridine38-40 synthase
LRLLIAYDGAPFSGWQSQTDGNAVQDHMERAVAVVTGTAVSVQGSGRTDAGVHALGQVAHVDVPAERLTLRKWREALNGNLPPGIKVLAVRRVLTPFHARFDATGKVYRYRIWNHGYLHPLEAGRAWHVPGKIDSARLRSAAAMLVGTHDFRRFAANRGYPETDTVRTLFSVRVNRRGPLWTLRFHGDGFLYRMVRMLTGALVRCAQGKEAFEWIAGLLAPENQHFQRVNPQAAPAEGLFLERVEYGGDRTLFEAELSPKASGPQLGHSHLSLSL